MSLLIARFSNVASTGSSANLIESKTYENPQFLRMKDLMGKNRLKINKKNK